MVARQDIQKHISLASQTQPTPARITFSITHREGRVRWCSVGFHVLCHNCHVHNLIGFDLILTQAMKYGLSNMGKYLPCRSMGNTMGVYTRYIIKSCIIYSKSCKNLRIQHCKLLVFASITVTHAAHSQQYRWQQTCDISSIGLYYGENIITLIHEGSSQQQRLLLSIYTMYISV